MDQKDSLGERPLPDEPCSACSGNGSFPSRVGLNVEPAVSSDTFEVECKVNKLINILENDIKAADIKWSLFVTSASSYKFDSCLKPFPSQFVEGQRGLDKNINKLRDIITQVPPLPSLLQKLQDPDMCQTISSEIIDLLYWNLEEQEPKLTALSKEESEHILSLAPSSMAVHKPHHMFRVSSRWGAVSESRWEEQVAQYGILHAYHGSKVENFHSILRYGLQQHMNKNGLFGEGIYLSSELGVSLPYSNTGCGWHRSTLGTQLSCVVLCEAINHPDVRCKQPVSAGSSPEEVRRRALSKGSLGGEVPDKYFLVRNSDLVRVRHLLVYAKNMSSPADSQRVAPCRESTTVLWIRRNKTAILISAYVFLLLAVGLGSSPSAMLALRRSLRKLGL